MRHYIIRYRCDDPFGQVALIVDDECGTAHFFRDGQLRDQLTGEGTSTRLARRLAARGPWVPVPEVHPYTIADLRRLTARSAAHEPARHGFAAAPVGWRGPVDEAPRAVHQGDEA